MTVNKTLRPSSATTFDHYVSEIRKIPLLTRAEELDLARRFRDQQDVAAAHKLVVSHLRFVVKIANEYTGYGIGLLDLIQEGNIGLMHAVRKFDPERGYRLITYAVWWIRDRIHSFVLRTFSLVKIGSGKISRRLFYKLKATLACVHQETDDKQAAIQIAAERLGVSENELTEMDLRLAARDFQLDNQTSKGDQTHLELLPEVGPSQEEAVSAKERNAILKQALDRVTAGLDNKERYILDHRLLDEDPATLNTVGKHFGVTRQRVQQIESRLIEKIRKQALEVEPEFGSATC